MLLLQWWLDQLWCFWPQISSLYIVKRVKHTSPLAPITTSNSVHTRVCVCHDALVDSKFDKSRQQQQCQLETKISIAINQSLGNPGGMKFNQSTAATGVVMTLKIWNFPDPSTHLNRCSLLCIALVLGNPFPISKLTWHQHVSVPETCHISSRFSFVFLKKFETRLPCHWIAKFKVLLAPAFSFMQPGLVVDSKRRV